MLSLRLRSGEYITIGDDIVVQVFEETCGTFLVSVKAPREVPVVRSGLLERAGQRPDGIKEKKPKSKSDRAHSAKWAAKCAARQSSREDS